MSKKAVTMLLMMLALVAGACGTAATTTSPTPSAAVPTLSATATPTGSPRPPEPTPVVLTVTGHVKVATDGRPVPGVRVRIAPFAISGGSAPKPPGPDVIVTTDASGAYSAAVSAWTLEALANSSSSQLSLFVTPPAGMKVVGVTQSITYPLGPLAPNDPQWYFMLARDLNGPIDITIAAQ